MEHQNEPETYWNHLIQVTEPTQVYEFKEFKDKIRIKYLSNIDNNINII